MVRRYSAFGEPWKFGHRLATLPIRPLGNAMRGASNMAEDFQPVVSQIGDKAVDAFAPAIESAAQAGLGSLSAMLKSAAAPAASTLASVAAPAAASATSAVPVVGPALAPAAGALGGAGGGLAGFSLANLAGFGADAVNAATPALSKLAVPAAKGLGRLAYSGFNNALSGTADVMGSYEDAPETSRGLRALKDAQNPFSLKELTKRGPSDWAREAGGVSELIDTSIGDSPAPSVSSAPMPMDDPPPVGRPAGDALKKSAPALSSSKPQSVGPPTPQFYGDASMLGPRTNQDMSGSDYGMSMPDGGVSFADAPMSMTGQKPAPRPTPRPARPRAPQGTLTNLLQQGIENPVERAEPMSEAAEGPPHPEPTGPFKYDDPNRPMTPGQKQGWGDATGGLSQLLNNAKYRGQQSPNDTFGYRGRR